MHIEKADFFTAVANLGVALNQREREVLESSLLDEETGLFSLANFLKNPRKTGQRPSISKEIAGMLLEIAEFLDKGPYKLTFFGIY